MKKALFTLYAGMNELAQKTAAWDILQGLRARERDVPTKAELERFQAILKAEEENPFPVSGDPDYQAKKKAWFDAELQRIFRKS